MLKKVLQNCGCTLQVYGISWRDANSSSETYVSAEHVSWDNLEIPNSDQKLIYIKLVRNKRLVKEFIDKPMLIVARKQNEI